MKTGADTGPCPRCGEQLGGRYLYGTEWRCWPCLPASWRHEPRKRRPAAEPYTVFVDRVWRAIERVTGFVPFVVHPGVWRSYCPVCLAGTVELRFSSTIEPPRFSGTCSNGCTDSEIGTLVFSI